MEKRVIAIGFFDGAHLGHGGLLKMARKRADELGCKAAVMTFDRHPSVVLTGKSKPLISGRRDREYLIKHLYGIDEVIFAHFGYATMNMHWLQFLEDCLIQDLNAVHLICGIDFTFGRGGEGKSWMLKEACERMQTGCDVIEEISLDKIPIHSTLIRGLLLQGRIEDANRYLGHPHCLCGYVTTGKQLGRTIGVPTANIPIPPNVLVLPKGVYVTKVMAEGKLYNAVTNIGCCPTVVEGAPLMVEPWILDFSGDLYGKEIRVFFYKKLRNEKKFPSMEALMEQIHLDAEATRAYFAEKE